MFGRDLSRGALISAAAIWIGVAVLIVSCSLLVGMAHGQEYFDGIMPAPRHHHEHPPEDRALHEQFYSTWKMPDHPEYSCCDDEDCYPTEARPGVTTEWQAKRREDGLWVDVPDHKVERKRQPPDGRAHMCAAPPERVPYPAVYCFAPPAGT